MCYNKKRKLKGKGIFDMADINLSDLLAEMSDPRALIEREVEGYRVHIRSTAEQICKDGKVRVVLLAGPSGSGKTTTANLISDEIKRLGMPSCVVSLDDFYRDATDDKYPRLKDGTRDFESPLALDTDMLLRTLSDIVSGKDFYVPKYDFKVGGRVDVRSYSGFSDGCVIIEGIHGLNPMLADPFPRDKLKRLFVSVSTNIIKDGKTLISGRKLRFVRRTVRDSLYRAADARRTLGMWENVLLGEDMYLYPYKGFADIRFDTFHRFEAAVMKPYAMKLLTDDVRRDSEYADIVARALLELPEIPDSLVPQDSLIREFIPGGIYEHLY